MPDASVNYKPRRPMRIPDRYAQFNAIFPQKPPAQVLTPLTNPELINYDVLLAIMSHMNPSDVLRFSRTCRTLYAAGLPALLRNRFGDQYTSREKFCSYYRFLLMDFPNRLSYVRHLYLSGNHRWSRTDGTNILVDAAITVLQHSPGLESLDIEDVEKLMALDENISPTIARLTSLRHLSLQLPNHESLQTLFHSLQSPLTTITLVCDNFTRVEILSLLSNFHKTLEELTLTGGGLTSCPKYLFYPNLHTLDMAGCLHDLALLARHAPNIRRLTFDTDRRILFTSGFDRMPGGSPLIWRSLDYLCGDTHFLWHSSITASVYHLRLKSDRVLVYHDMLVKVLNEIRPPFLDINTTIYRPRELKDLINALPADHTWLKRVQLSLKIPCREMNTSDVVLQVQKLMDPLVALVEDSSIVQMGVSINLADFNEVTIADRSKLQNIANKHYRSVPTRIMTQAPSMRHLSLQLPYGESRAWSRAEVVGGISTQ